MPLDKKGSYHMNPQIARMHDGAEQPEAAATGHAHAVTIHHPEGKDNPSPGKHHVIAHHEGGDQASDHESFDEAAQHAKAELGHEEGEGETCPECGAEMEGGKCPSCGYQAQHDEEQPLEHA